MRLNSVCIQVFPTSNNSGLASREGRDCVEALSVGDGVHKLSAYWFSNCILFITVHEESCWFQMGGLMHTEGTW